MADTTSPKTLKEAASEIVKTFKAIIFTPKILHGINIPYFLEGLAYFGVATVLTKFLHDNVGMTDQQSGYIMGLFTGGITLSMFFLGGATDRLGIRKSLVVAFIFFTVGRGVLALSGNLFSGGGLFSSMSMLACIGIFIMVIAYGLYEPAAYAGIRKYTNPKTAAMAYAVLYAVMNLGGFVSGVISPPIRLNFGIPTIFWIYTILTAVAIVVTVGLVTRKNEAAIMEPGSEKALEDDARIEEEMGRAARADVTLLDKLIKYFRYHPLRNAKFFFFIFILIPVRTLLAHQWLTVPLYIDRAFKGSAIGSHFEFFANLNPIIIFFGAPLVALFTARVNTYKMMIIGTLVMAASTFLLVPGPDPYLLIIYILVMSVGEAMWNPRFMQWVTEIAPEGQVGAYIGIARLPWFLTKFITASYSGWFLANYCPAEGELKTGQMWLIYALIAVATPVLLILAKNWAGKGKEMEGN